jgi:hypothetical protein
MMAAADAQSQSNDLIGIFVPYTTRIAGQGRKFTC